MANTRPLILTGSISLDRIMNFSGSYKDLIQKDKLHVLSLSVLINELTESRGGVASNIGYTLGLLGETPILLGSIGEKDKTYMADLEKNGINISYVHYSQLPTATYTVLTDKDDNQVGGFYPGAMSDSSGLTLSPWHDQNPLVVISANDPSTMERLVAECVEQKLEYIYDVGQQVSNISASSLREGVDHAHILMVNDYELGIIAKKLSETETSLNSRIPLVVTTLGANGSRISGKELSSPISVGVVPGVIPLDPTGAGDAYRAGFLHGYLHGQNLKICGQLGATAAAYTVEKLGTQTHHFSKKQFNTRYLKAFEEDYEQK